MAVGFIVYFAVLRVCLNTQGVQLTEYQGMGNLSALDAGTMLSMVPTVYSRFIGFFMEQGYGLMGQAIPLFFWIIGIFTLVLIVVLIYKTGFYKKLSSLILFIVLLAIFPLATNATYLQMADTVFSFASRDEAKENTETRVFSGVMQRITIVICWVQSILFSLIFYNNFLYTNEAYLKASVAITRPMLFQAIFMMRL